MHKSDSPPPSFRKRTALGLLSLDPRLKLVFSAALGTVAWHSGPVGLAAAGICAVCLAAVLGGFRTEFKATVRAWGTFVLLWFTVKFGVDLFSGIPAIEAAPGAALLAGRLFTLIALGLCLAQSASPRQLGLAVTWFLRPVMGRHAWKPALSLALMIHFLPLVRETFATARQTAELRAAHLPWHRRTLLALQAGLRSLSRMTWSQTVAVAARGLDDPAAWTPAFTPQPAAWLGGALLLSFFSALAFL